MAQSPWVTIPTSTSSSMTSTDRTRLSRIWRKASTTMSPERTWTRAPLFWARAFFTVLIDVLSWRCPAPALIVPLKDSRKILRRQHRSDEADVGALISHVGFGPEADRQDAAAAISTSTKG